jgi:rod shape-determining protein MreC
VARNVRGEGRLDTGLVLVCLTLSVLALFSPQRTREGISGVLRSTVLSPLIRLEARASAMRAAIDARPGLLVAGGRALTDTLSLRAISDENATMRALLGLSARLRDGFVPADVLPARGVEEFSITLTAGSDAGIQPFLPVVTADGLVGMVESVDPGMSSAIAWAHPDFRVSAMSVDQSAFGIIQPHLASGAERWLLEMRGVPFRAKLDTGTLIVSSGLGATYPRGIPVGTVIGELSTPEKWARTYLIKPAVLPENIGPVFVLLPARAQRGVNGVWTSVAAADSAARAVAAAGDSLARNAALDELAARRAAFDSLAADSSVLADTIGGGLARRPAPAAAGESARPAGSMGARRSGAKPPAPRSPARPTRAPGGRR